jgi:hypothetical protein
LASAAIVRHTLHCGVQFRFLLGTVEGAVLLTLIDRCRLCAVLALIFTALLAIAGYVVQSKNATAADRAQHEIVQEAADRELSRARADMLLDDVRKQQAELLSPCNCIGNTVSYNKSYLDAAIGFQPSALSAAFKQVQPAAQSFKVFSFQTDPVALQHLAPTIFCHKYTQQEIQMLADDDSKRDMYTSAYRVAIVPRLRELSGIIRRNGHILSPNISMTDGPMFKLMDAALGISVKDFWGGNLRQLYFYYMAYCAPQSQPPAVASSRDCARAVKRQLLSGLPAQVTPGSQLWRGGREDPSL